MSDVSVGSEAIAYATKSNQTRVVKHPGIQILSFHFICLRSHQILQAFAHFSWTHFFDVGNEGGSSPVYYQYTNKSGEGPKCLWDWQADNEGVMFPCYESFMKL
ncbi:hypothetical protein C4D60_Mb00t20090 [Musa balbisiana]|uniref:Uncharacterized protein n=1 Tax=Musa balbisiana TaxID=52838 RepID=A0A4V4H1X7_MUSBA|nr:hypothetical protein C4D60_Mb00t20090 [Musa balbisiana]